MTRPEPGTATVRRRAAYRRGLGSETRALLLLMLKGYRPLGRRYAAGGGEVDLVMRRGRTVAFVEVKARAALADAHAAIDGRKRARFSRAVRSWIARYPQPPDTTFRADAVLVAPRSWPVHVADVFAIEGM